MFLRIIKTNDSLITIKNGTLIQTDDYWYIPKLATPESNRIPDEVLKKTHTLEQHEELIKYTRFYLQDSEDENIIYKFVIFQSQHNLSITTDIYDNRKYLCGRIIGLPFYKTFDLPEHKKVLKFMIELSRNHP